MQMWSLDQEDPLGEGMATRSHLPLTESAHREAWWATFHRVPKSQTGLKHLAYTHKIQ